MIARPLTRRKRSAVNSRSASFENLDEADLGASVAVDTADDDPVTNVLDILVKAGANMNLPDQYGLGPLHHAAMRGNMKVVR